MDPFFLGGASVFLLSFSLITFYSYVTQKWHKMKYNRVVDLLKGLELCINSNYDVLAVCSKGAFFDAFEEYKKLVVSGKEPLWGKIMIKVKPTFTFSIASNPRLSHTGNQEEWEMSIWAFVYNKTKISRDEFAKYEQKDIFDSAFKKEVRLYVPYSTSSAVTAEEDYRFFGKASADDFLRLFV